MVFGNFPVSSHHLKN